MSDSSCVSRVEIDHSELYIVCPRSESSITPQDKENRRGYDVTWVESRDSSDAI
jgi:hypothetical protein